MASNLQTNLRAAGYGGQERDTSHSFRLSGGTTSHDMDGTAMGVLEEYVGLMCAAVAGRYAGGARHHQRRLSRGTKRSRDAASVDADA